MVLPDVNVLVYAHREDSGEHEISRLWLESILNADAHFGISELVLSGFLRVVTHSNIFKTPSPLTRALSFVEEIRSRPTCVLIQPGERHWGIFQKLCLESKARGNWIPDAYFAALAIESGCEWITWDNDYARFKGLKWAHPDRC